MTHCEAEKIWNTLCGCLAQRLQERTYQDWVAPCSPVSFDAEAQNLWIHTPSDSVKFWIEHQMAEEFHDALVRADMPDIRLIFTVADSRQASTDARKASGGSASKKANAPALNSFSSVVSCFPQGFDRYTLENFVVGKGSQFAFSAAAAIVEKCGFSESARNINPLFIYGGSGLGKTHLMVGIGKGLLNNNPQLRLAYVKMDSFFHEVTAGIRAKNTEPVRQKYQSNDALLIDDIQTLQGMERTQEEIFYVIEHLLQHGKQLIITSDNPRLEGLNERLATRCKWGLTVDIPPPDFETRVAILKQKLENPAFSGYPPVPEEVLVFVANKAKASVRDLEGLLTRVIFQANFLGSAVTMDVALDAYKGLTGVEPTASISIERICKAVANHFGVSVNDLVRNKTRQHRILIPRQLAMYLSRELASKSFEEIGNTFNGMHHSTVMNAISSINRRMHKDPDFNKVIQSLLNSID
jgi:chromosomal replication initiator protein